MIANAMKKALTVKQKVFVKEYVASKGNGTQSALKAYDTDDLNTAHAIASENLQKPAVRKAIDTALVALNLTPEYSLKGFKDLHEEQKKRNPMASIRALENIAAIQDLYPKSNASLDLSSEGLKISWES
jgi:phage terminase small subunit